MKQYKMKNFTPTATTHTKSTPSTTRQELDVQLKQLARLVEENPRKAAKIFESWLHNTPKSQSKKKAA